MIALKKDDVKKS